jgi:hypothetical protein
VSYESVVEHMQRELVAGATRRRRRERMHRGIAAVVVAAAVVVGAVALTRDDQQATQVSTEPTEPTAEAREAARTEACNSYLDLTDLSIAPGPSTAAAFEQIAALAARSGDQTLMRITATLRDKYPKAAGDTTSDETSRELGDAYRELIAHCRGLGVAGLNPVYVPAPGGPAPRVDLNAYGTNQPLEFVTQPPTRATPPQGRGLSSVAIAATSQGAYVMTWSYQNATATARQHCRAFGNPNGGSRTCGAANDPKAVPLSGAIRPVSINIRDATVIEASDSVSFVVFEAPGVRLVQRPASGIAIFEWQATAPATRNDFTARAYDADGQLLGCVASGTSSC